MPPAKEDNPIVRQLHLLGQQWMEFTAASGAVMGVWRVESDQTGMINSFPYLEDTEHGIVPSIFLTFKTPFADPEKYAYGLIEELLINIGHPESRASLEEGGVNIDLLTVDEIKDTRAWLKLMADFAAMVKPLEGHFVAYLNPDEIAEEQAWVQWMAKLLKLDIPEKVRLMAMEEPGFAWFDNLKADFPDRLEGLVPKLDMDAAMREILEEATRKNPDDPGTQFRQAMLEAGQATGKNQMPEAEKAAARAMAIAREADWQHLQIAVLFILANGYIGVKDYDNAIARYRQAQEIAAAYAAAAPEMAGQLDVQARMGEAGCYLGLKDFATAAEYYAKAAPPAAALEKHHLELEAWRMAGFCHQYLKDNRRAWDYYRQAWSAGEKLPPEIRTTTTLPHVGQALLELRPKAEVAIKQYQLEDEIVSLLGQDWQNLLKTAAS